MFLPSDLLSSDDMVDSENDSVLVIGGGDKKIMKGCSCYTTRDNYEVTLRNTVVVVPVST